MQYTNTRYKIQDTKYKTQNTRYKIQNTKYKIQNTKTQKHKNTLDVATFVDKQIINRQVHFTANQLKQPTTNNKQTKFLDCFFLNCFFDCFF